MNIGGIKKVESNTGEGLMGKCNTWVCNIEECDKGECIKGDFNIRKFNTWERTT